MPDHPIPATPSQGGSAPQPIPPSWLLSALALVLAGVSVASVEPDRTELERAFLRLTARDAVEHAGGGAS